MKSRLKLDLRYIPKERRKKYAYLSINTISREVGGKQNARYINELMASRSHIPKKSKPNKFLIKYWQNKLNENIELRKECREIANMSDNRPVFVVNGDFPPKELGESFVKYHWHNKDAIGTVYHPSTRRVEVGVKWLAAGNL